MEHFRVLPTDERFKSLTEDQLEVLYFSFLKTPSDDAIKRTYYENVTGKEKAKKLPREYLKEKMGYSEEDIKQIEKDIKRNG